MQTGFRNYPIFSSALSTASGNSHRLYMAFTVSNLHHPYSFQCLKLLGFNQVTPDSVLPYKVCALKRSSSSPRQRKLPKNLRNPRRAKVPPDQGVYKVPIKKKILDVGLLDSERGDHYELYEDGADDDDSSDRDAETSSVDAYDGSVWSPEEITVITSLFERGPPRKYNKSQKERPLPLPTPHKSSLPRLPTPKHHIRSSLRAQLASRSALSNRVYKNPEVLVGIAKEIGSLPPNVDASEVLNKWGQFLRKGSLSMTIRELGHMDLPERALQTLCWAQKQNPTLFPDDRVLASTVEVLARNKQLKMEHEMDRYMHSASRSVMEALARGFIRAGSLNLARRIILSAREHGRMLSSDIYAKLILEVGKNPDKHRLAEVLIDELGARESLDLKQQDCTSIMKVCIRLRKFELVESLFSWWKESGSRPSMVMYTTLVYSRYCEMKYREALAIVWEMEEEKMTLDLPAYRVIIRLCVALNDTALISRYYSRLKEDGFAPTYDIYRDMIKVYAASGRLAKCRQICKEMEATGLKLDYGTVSLLQCMENDRSIL